MRRISLAIIGCGTAIERLHLPVIEKHKSYFEIYALCGRSEKRNKLGKRFPSLPYFSDFRECLAKSSAEAVIVALPINMNAEVVPVIFQMGKHLLLEKPIAGDLKAAQNLLSKSSACDSVKLLGENLRYSSTIQRAREILLSGVIGEPRAVYWNSIKHVDLEKQSEWRQNSQHEGGYILDGGVHYVAALRCIFDEILPTRSVYGSANRRLGSIDTFTLHFQTPQGVNGILNILRTSCLKGKAINECLVFGSQGSLTVRLGRLQVERDGEVVLEEHLTDDGGYQGQYLNFYNAIVNGAPVESSFKEGLRDLEVIVDAINLYDHARSGYG